MSRADRSVGLIAPVVLACLFLIARPLAADETSITVTYYGEIGCAHCDAFVGTTVPRLEATYDVTIVVEAKDILIAEIFAECRDRMAALGREFVRYPVLFVGNNVYSGVVAVSRGIEAELAYLHEHGEFRPQVPETLDGSLEERGVAIGLDEKLPLIPVLLAGLADGVNPCAFATIVFLMSLLAVAGRTRRQILAIGLLYAATVLTTYVAIGFGLLAVVRTAMNVVLLRMVVRIVVSATAGTFALLSVRDVFLLRSGRRSDVMLQLSLRRKQQIHNVIRRGVRGGGLVTGTIGLAFLVSLLELACTGQLYLPTIAYLVQTDSAAATEVLALLGYNLAFILPLVAVVLIVSAGVSSQRIAAWFSRRATGAKIAMAAVFAVLAVAIWFV